MSDAGRTRFDRLVDLAEELLRIDSVTGDERRIADRVEQRLRERAPHALVRAGNSLCVVPRRPDPARATVMLVGHLDTVPRLSDDPVRRDAGRLFGLGASDMKAAVALILATLERALEQAPRHDLVGVLYAREEGPYADNELPLVHAAARAWFDATDLAVCMEPTDNRIELGCLGTCHARVTFLGRRAHSARPWQGDNAIHKAAGLLARLQRWGRRRLLFDGLEFSEVMSATLVEMRGARNVVPDNFTVNVNYRFAPGKDRAAVEREVGAVVAGEAGFEIVDFCPAGRVCRDNRLVGELEAALGGAEVCAKQAWTDVGRLSELGIDAINFGPGATSQAHQAGEWIELEALAAAQRALDAWLFPG